MQKKDADKSAPRAANKHALVKSQILKEIGSDRDIMVWNNPTGVFFAPGGRVVKVGVTGQGDIIGLMRKTVTVLRVICPEDSFTPHNRQREETIGMMFAIEVKTGKGEANADQKKWRAAFEDFGGRYEICHSAEEAREFIKELRDI